MIMLHQETQFGYSMHSTILSSIMVNPVQPVMFVRDPSLNSGMYVTRMPWVNYRLNHPWIHSGGLQMGSFLEGRSSLFV